MPYSWLNDAQLEAKEIELREAAHNAPKEIGRSCGAYAQRAYDWSVVHSELERRQKKRDNVAIDAFLLKRDGAEYFEGFSVDDVFCSVCSGPCQHVELHSVVAPTFENGDPKIVMTPKLESFEGKCKVCGKPLGPPGAPDLDPTRCYKGCNGEFKTVEGTDFAVSWADDVSISVDGSKTVHVDKPYTEENCPGHIASTSDPKVCGWCGVHIDSLRPPDDE